MDAYGGADIHVYRVPNPIEFLKKQKNLHRIRVDGSYAGEGLANALRTAWDAWIVRSREAWRGLFSKEARRDVVAEAPQLKIQPDAFAPTRYAQNPQYRPLKGFELKDSFRYPVSIARTIQPPAGVKLEGSSSEFVPTTGGNVMIPIGTRAPGLYLVEAVIGQHRATTVVFVSDTVAVTKISSGQLLAWTANRKTGAPVRGVQVAWTDGVGVLKSGETDARGIATLERSAPEQTYVIGEDRDGGVLISENFYYDSEIYNTKLFAITDRPLYRPGDQVFIKVVGRTFTSARASETVPAADLEVQVYDPNGLPVSQQRVGIRPDTGADTSFRLPDNAAAGGYEIRFALGGDRYGAAFRVAEYQKPHFEISVLPGKPTYHTGEAISGRVQLSYPDGTPVRHAAVELLARGQQMTLVDGDLGYSGQFPVKLSNASLTTDDHGIASFALPAATVPSRYVLTALATDGAAYRVRVSRELLIERGAGAYTVKPEREFSMAGETLAFAITPVGETALPPVRWELIRLENRARQSGQMSSSTALSVKFPEPGSYALTLYDAQGNVVGACNHFVGGPGAVAPAGSIGIVFDKAEYQPGDVAEALITFPVPVADALVTLERDQVERSALLSGGGDWIKIARESPAQWRARLRVKEDHAPNMTLSVAYVKDGDYVFQNQGLRVAQAKIQIEFKTPKTVYAPGDEVDVEVLATSKGKPVSALISVGVVDEMIYVLQPEIAPEIFDFFYHPRRNNVRTTASLSFIGYDLAAPRSGGAPSRRRVHERALKVLERPRREDIDTAYWNGKLTTDASGHAHFRFTMPDSLTRWRITGRAIDAAGLVGQKQAWVRSDKPIYAKWTSPDWLREADAPIASVAVFNQTASSQTVDFSAEGGGISEHRPLTLKPGANFAELKQGHGPGSTVDIRLTQAGKLVDHFEVHLKSEPTAWLTPHTLALDAAKASTPLTLPADATHLRLRLGSGADSEFARIADDLIEYPYGCVEQTASRLIPLSLAIRAFAGTSQNVDAVLRQKAYSQRFRLAQMAGPDARFSWWGDGTRDNAFLTAYAYYADWVASRTLGLELPPGHWEHLLDSYAKDGFQLPALQRALTLSWMHEMGLPVTSLVDVMATDLAVADSQKGKPEARDSVVMSDPAGREGLAAARLLTAHLLGAQAQSRFGTLLGEDVDVLRKADTPFTAALLMLAGKDPASGAEPLLSQVRNDMPSFERAMALQWTWQALGGKPGPAKTLPVPLAPWRRVETATGTPAYVLSNPDERPVNIAFATAPGTGLKAFIDFDSRAPVTANLPVVVERHLFRLGKVHAQRGQQTETQGGRGVPPKEADVAAITTDFELEPMAVGEVLHTDQLYLDDIVLRPTGKRPVRFGLLEAALPPGASVERGTWGIGLRSGDKVVPLERARNEISPMGYTVPVDPLEGEIHLRHLVRFAQKGHFALPPARFSPMYQPGELALEEKEKAWTRVQVE